MSKRIASWALGIGALAFMAALTLLTPRATTAATSSRAAMQSSGFPLMIYAKHHPPGEGGGTVVMPGQPELPHNDSHTGGNCSGGSLVNYFSGEIIFQTTDIESKGFGGWGVTLDYATVLTNASYPGNANDFPIGQFCMMQWPRIVIDPWSQKWIAVTGARHTAAFDPSNSYNPMFFHAESLSFDNVAHELTVLDGAGNRTIYYQFGEILPNGANVGGLFKRYYDAFGNVTQATWVPYDSPTGLIHYPRISLIQRSYTSGGNTYSENWNYSWSPATNQFSPLLSDVRLTQTFNSNPAVPVRSVIYTYDTSGNLSRAYITGGGYPETKYYRYYPILPGSGFIGLKYAVMGRGYERLKAAYGGSDSTVDAAVVQNGDSIVAPYATRFAAYETGIHPLTWYPRVVQQTVQGEDTAGGECACGSNGTQSSDTYLYSWGIGSAYNTSNLTAPILYNSYAIKMVESLPDGNSNVVYSNAVGEAIFKRFYEASSGREWRTSIQYDANSGKEILCAMPSAVASYIETGDFGSLFVTLNTNSGLIQTKIYNSTQAGTPGPGYLQSTYVKQGTNDPSPTIQSTLTYTTRTGVGTIYPVASKTLYRNTGGGGPQTTNYTFAWQGSTNQELSKTTAYPAVTSQQNGAGASDTEVEYFDTYGRRTWLKDGDGFIQYEEYDPNTAAVTKHITDVNTTTTPDFSNLPNGWTTPSGGGLHLKTLASVDLIGRPTRSTDPNGNLTYLVYNDATREKRVYPGWNTATNRPTGPTQIRREDWLNSYVDILTTVDPPTMSGGTPNVPTGQEALTTANLRSLSRSYLDQGDRPTNIDSYFSFTGWTYPTQAGTQGTNFYRKTLGYDNRGRLTSEVDWTGTIRTNVYDGRCRLVSTWIGTTGANKIQLTANEYDGNQVGDDNLTKTRTFTSVSTSLDTAFVYDYRDRIIQKRGPDNVAIQSTLDNLGNATEEKGYADANSNFTIDSGELRGDTQSNFDEKGQLYQTIRFNVDPATGTAGNTLTTNYWYNHRGMKMKSRGPNGEFSKSQIDGAGRVLADFISFDDSETQYSSAFLVDVDTVLDELVNTYDANGNLIQTTKYRKTPGSPTGAGDLAGSWSPANSRRTYTAQWFDAANRLMGQADYGTNGNATLVRPTSPPAPNSSSYLLTTYAYDDGGRQYQVRDNLNRLTQRSFDGLDRVTTTIENYVTGNPTETSLDTDRKTETIFDAQGRLRSMKAYNPKGAGAGVQIQQTVFLFGTTSNQSTPPVYRNDVVTVEIYPDSDDSYTLGGDGITPVPNNGTDGVYDRVEYTYDYASRKSTVKDQRQVLHTYGFDPQGRMVTDSVAYAFSGTRVDLSILRKEYQYDSLSRRLTASSFNAASGGTLVNQVRFTYDGWGNPIKREDSHQGAVVPGTTPSVQMAYADGASGGVAKYVRPASTTYPNGAIVYFNYPTPGSASTGDHLSRIDNIAQDSAGVSQYAQYSYMGAKTVLDINHPLVSGGLVYRQGPEDNPGAWDQFDRQIFTKWRNSAITTTFDMYNYTYDKVSNRLTRQVASTTLPPSGQEKDEAYTPDGLNRLVKLNRGLLSGGTITDASRKFGQAWTLESMGGWRQFQVAQSGGATYNYVQSRLHNSANEIDDNNADYNGNYFPNSSISTTGTPSYTSPVYEKGGNTYLAPAAATNRVASEGGKSWYTYDAWNRLVAMQADNVGESGGTTVVIYQFDALDHRIAKLIGTTTPSWPQLPPNWDRTDYYFNFKWQCVEERRNLNVAGTSTVANLPYAQYIWDLMYVDAPVLRRRNADQSADGSLEEILYYTRDASNSTTALVNPAGTVVERYVYEAYGRVTTLTAGWAAQASTVYANEILFQGCRWDPEAALYHVRARALHPTLGRWMQRDPIGYDGGSMDLYEYVGGHPTIMTDPSGLYGWEDFKRDVGWTWTGVKEVVSAVKPVVASQFVSNETLKFRHQMYINRPGKVNEIITDQIILIGFNFVGVPGFGEFGGFGGRGGRGGNREMGVPEFNRGETGAQKAPQNEVPTKGAGKQEPPNVESVDKTFQTYTKTRESDGKVYSGRTSGRGKPEENVANRDASPHHKNAEGYGPARLDKSSLNSDAIRGREQQLIEQNGRAKSEGGTSGNDINGTGPRNSKRDQYQQAAEKEFGRPGK